MDKLKHGVSAVVAQEAVKRLREQLAAAEAQRDRLADACKITLDELPRDEEGIEVGDLQRIVSKCFAALSLTPEAALEERRAVEAVVKWVRDLVSTDHGICWPDLAKALARLDEIREKS